MVMIKQPAFLKYLIIIALALNLSACGSKDKKEAAEEETLPAEALYNSAMEKLERKKYNASIELFEQIERTYPYSKWATKAQIMSAYTSYKDDEYDDAILSAERFIKLHPGHKDVSYAYYLKAISFYEQITDVARDQSYTVEARRALKEIIARFPASEYARDAQIKLDLVQDHLAGKELEVGRFYLRNNKTIAAINRFKKVVEKYETTGQIEEALHRLVESYMSLGIVPEAKKYAAVLGHNYPGSKWYERSYRLIEGRKLPKGGDDKTNEWLGKVPSVGKKDKPLDLETDLKNKEKVGAPQ